MLFLRYWLFQVREWQKVMVQRMKNMTLPYRELLRGLYTPIFTTRSFPSLQAAYMVDTWQKVAVSESELPKQYLLLWAQCEQSYDFLKKNKQQKTCKILHCIFFYVLIFYIGHLLIEHKKFKPESATSLYLNIIKVFFWFIWFCTFYVNKI
jgi:hypothetical protein